MIGENAISYRTIKDDVNVSNFAKLIGNGDSHPKAAGNPITLK